MTTDAAFWDRSARKYARSKIGNMAAYNETLAAVGELLGQEDDVLELGCGTGSTALHLAPSVARITGTDISGAMIDIARDKAQEAGVGNATFELSGAAVPGYETGRYDVVLAFNLLHLVEDLPGVLTRAHEVLKPGGLFISKTPCLGEMGVHIRLMVAGLRLIGKAPFVSFPTRAGIEAEIERAGFSIETARSFTKAPRSWFVVARKGS